MKLLEGIPQRHRNFRRNTASLHPIPGRVLDEPAGQFSPGASHNHTNNMTIKPTKNAWVVVWKSGGAADWTISYTRKRSIEKYIEGGAWTWRKHKAKGARCIKVNIEFHPVEKTTTTPTWQKHGKI